MKHSASRADTRQTRHSPMQNASRISQVILKAGSLVVYALALGLILGAATAEAGLPHKRVRVGYCPSYGIISTDKAGQYTGYGYDYLLDIAKYTGWKYEFVPGTWQESLERLKKGSIDLLGPMQATEDRRHHFLFPKHEMGYEYGVLYARADNHDLHYDDFATFEGMRVGIVTGNFYNEPFEAYRKHNNFNVKYIAFADPETMMRALEQNRIDTAICAGLFSSTNVKLVARFSVEPFYIAAAQGREALVHQLEQAVSLIRINNIYYDATLYAKYFRSKEISQPAFSRQEERFLRSGPVLRMAVQTDWVPMEMMNDSGMFHGISVDLMRVLMERCGLRLQLIPVRTFPEAVQGIKNGTIDLICGYGAPRDSAMLPGLQLTSPYLQVPVVLVGGKGTPPANGHWRVAVPAGYSSLRAYISENYKDATLLSVDNFSACLQAVRQGKADLALSTSYFYDKMGGSPEFENLRIVSVTNVLLPMSIGVSGNLPPFVYSVLEKALTRISERELNESIFSNTVPQQQLLSLEAALREYSMHLWALGGLVVLMGGSFYIHLRRQTEQRLRRMAYIDPLTGHPNWNQMTQDAEELLGKSQYACVVLDIDNFKLVNDYFGYETGSRALCHTADTIASSLKSGEIAARRSGDIFVLLLAYQNEQALFARLADLQEQIMNFAINTDGEGKILYTACGVCLAQRDDADLNKLYDRANTARKSIKPVHGNICALYDDAMSERVVEEQEIEKHMEQALLAGEFQVYLQPKYDLKTEHMAGAEALVRWNHPSRGLISPDVFIQLFERNGFILKLDMFIFEQVCQLIRRWLDKGMLPVPIAVNISKVHIHTSDFVRNVQEIVRRYQIPPKYIELELTETAFFDNTSALLSVMRQLVESGFTLSMDDFGSGYSSLNMLKDIPVQVLKLDRAFFDHGESENRGQLVVSYIIQMAKALHMKVVSEGVETREQVDFLRSIECDFAQGFYYARPTPIHDFESLIFPEDAPSKKA